MTQRIKPGTAVMYIDYMERTYPAIVLEAMQGDMYDLIVFRQDSDTVLATIARSVGMNGVRGSRFELTGVIPDEA